MYVIKMTLDHGLPMRIETIVGVHKTMGEAIDDFNLIAGESFNPDLIWIEEILDEEED